LAGDLIETHLCEQRQEQKNTGQACANELMSTQRQGSHVGDNR
jgi:hypothetical protein